MMDRERAETLDDLVRLIKNEFNTELVLLFGSRARGDNLIESDYDIIIVSKDFEGINFIKRMGLVQDLWGGIYRLEAFYSTPEEVERKRNDIGTVQEACKEG
ncbi:MAG: nucleotidyltransferase domain-containing protein, partial [Dehalococcoidales bacterium]|nr:nucleotidyltransferase domain-containing protein [Dehalococcoidales bacterium]